MTFKRSMSSKVFLCIFKVCNKKRLSGRKSRNLCSFPCRLNSRASKEESLKCGLNFTVWKKEVSENISRNQFTVSFTFCQCSEWKYRIHGIFVKSWSQSYTKFRSSFTLFLVLHTVKKPERNSSNQPFGNSILFTRTVTFTKSTLFFV